jgi:hypothetical protein
MFWNGVNAARIDYNFSEAGDLSDQSAGETVRRRIHTIP